MPDEAQVKKLLDLLLDGSLVSVDLTLQLMEHALKNRDWRQVEEAQKSLKSMRTLILNEKERELPDMLRNVEYLYAQRTTLDSLVKATEKELKRALSDKDDLEGKAGPS